MAQDSSTLIINIKANTAQANANIKKTTQKMNDFRLSTVGIRRSLGAIRNNLLVLENSNISMVSINA